MNQLNAFKNKQLSTAHVTQHKPQGNTQISVSKGSAFVSRSGGGISKTDTATQAMRTTMLHKIVKHLRDAHKRGDTHELSLTEVNDECSFANNITEQTRRYLESEGLPNHSKIEVLVQKDASHKYKFKPPFEIKNRKGLEKKLKEYHEYQLGAVSVEDVEECMEKAGRAIERLAAENKIYKVTTGGQKKKDLLFYQDRRIDAQFDDTMKRYWREASVEGMTDDKIAQFLKSKGVKGVVQNFGHKIEPMNKRKKKGAADGKKRPRKELNKHVAGLKDYAPK